METTGNQNVDLNSQIGTIVATHPHLQLNRNSILSDPHQSILWCTRARALRGFASHVFLVMIDLKGVKKNKGIIFQCPFGIETSDVDVQSAVKLVLYVLQVTF